MRLRLLLPALLATLALAIAACSGSDGVSAIPDEPSLVPPGRILVLTAAGELFTVRPDGGDRVDLGAAGSPAQGRRQPVWSPTGERIAWVEVDARTAPVSSALVTSAADGSDRTRAPIAATPFFTYWDPTGTRVAYLAPAGGTIELGVVDLAGGGGEATRLATGQPFYVSWAPAGDRLFGHIGAGRLASIAIDGTLSSLSNAGGLFNAPQWSVDAGRLVYAVRTGGEQRLVSAQIDRPDLRTLLVYEGAIRFVLSRDGNRLAYRTIDVDRGAPDPDSRTAGSATAQAVANTLVVLDLDTGRSQPVTTAATATFYWSPDGRSLLYSGLGDGAGSVRLRWHVWRDGRSISLASFVPTDVYARDYLPFFDQFALAISPWSPDGAHFVYASSEPGAAGVWVEAADGATPPVRIASGSFATWSPR